MRWKVIFDYLYDKCNTEGCDTTGKQRDERLAEIIPDYRILEGTKDVLDALGGHCSCEVFWNAIEYLDARMGIPTVPDKTLKDFEERVDELLKGEDHDAWAKRLNLSEQESAKNKKMFLTMYNKAIEAGRRE